MANTESRWRRDPLRERSRRSPERLALIDAKTGRTWTYADLDAFVDGIAAWLDDEGLESGGTLATLLGSRPLTAVLPFATVRLGATVAPLNVDLDRSTLADQLDRLAPDLLLRSDETADDAADCFDGPIRTVDGSAAPDATSADHDRGRDDGSGERASERGSRTPSEGLAPDETALVIFTSGTTGRPKGVRLTLENLLASATASATRLGVTPHDRWLSPLSTYHVGGLAPYVRSTLYGTAAILQRSFDAATTARLLDRYDVTGVSLVPTMLRRVLDAGWRPSDGFRFVLLGGGPAPDALLGRCLDIGVPVCPTYGATETASQVTTATPGETELSPGSVGRPLVGTSVEVRGEARGEDPETTGELVVTGPTVAPGYLDRDATTEAFADGRFHTGDLGYRDDAGRWWIVGRADDVIVTGGENVRPSTVVDALESHPAVEAAAVVGRPDQEWGERVSALVVTTMTASTSESDLREWCRGRVPDFAVPKDLNVVAELPRTPSGTIDREAVRERFD